MTTDAIVEKLLKEIESAIGSFNAAIPDIQKVTFNKVQNLLKELETSNGRLISSAKNIRAIGQLKEEINKAVLNPDYIAQAADFTDAFNVVTDLQNNYFASLNVDYTPKKVAEELRKLSIDTTIEALTESGIDSNVTAGVQQILKSNISGGGYYSDLMDQMRTYLLTDEGGAGALESYTKQITTDSLNQYSAQYNQLITHDLKFSWHQYVGSLRGTSRDFCKKLVQKRWVHDSELEDVLKGHIGSQRVTINPKTGVWYGGIEGTNKATFATNRGGYSCNHQWYGVSDEFVPKELQEKFTSK